MIARVRLERGHRVVGTERLMRAGEQCGHLCKRTLCNGDPIGEPLLCKRSGENRTVRDCSGRGRERRVNETRRHVLHR